MPTPNLNSNQTLILTYRYPDYHQNLMVIVRFSVPDSYTNYRPNKLPLLRATWCETKYYTNHQYRP